MTRRWMWAAAAAAAAGWLGLRAAGVFRVEVHGPSMSPSLRPGDWLVATRAGRVRRGTVVILAEGRMDMVKRVSGVPGDVAFGHRLGPDEYFVIGDDPARSTDGRTFGPVRREAIEGIVRFRYWPHLGPVPGRALSKAGRLARRRVSE